MNYVYSFYDNVRYYYNSMNPNTLSGAIDVIVVEQPDGTYLSSPFHVRFGKWAVFNVNEKYVDIQINNQVINNVKMKLGDNGVAFFVEEIKDDEELPDYLITSPLPSPSPSNEPKKKVSMIVVEREKKNKKEKDGPSHTHNEVKRSQRNKSTIVPPTKDLSLPFSSSIFSCRKYRSLPDLSVLTQYDDLNQNVKPFAQFKDKSNEQKSSFEFESKERKTKSSEKSVSFCPVFDTADDALSDSELDQQRFGSSNDAEWHWGEIPDFKNKQADITKELKSSSSSWRWFGWRSPQRDEGVGSLVDTSANQTEMYYRTSSSSQTSNTDSGKGSMNSPLAMSVESLIEENVAKAVKKEAPTPLEISTSLKKADIVEKQILASTDNRNSVMATSTFNKEGNKNLEKHKRLPPKVRSMSGASIDSNVSLLEEGVGIFTSTTNGRSIRYKRTLRLKSEDLKDLNLQYGSNNARFSISTSLQGTAWCGCHIYLLKPDEKIVISDIDGTITKSDVLGHIIPAIGGTWAHTNIVDIYQRIQNNGYRIIYLSSRAIGQSYQTKRYLSSVIQNSKTLPDGPVLLSPTSVLTALRKEIIERRPEEFKIACLADLMSLFPSKRPVYAGFGNRETDIKSYLAVGIPPERILIINPTGKVESASRIGFETNYDTMLKDNVVDHFFPPLTGIKSLKSSGKSKNSSFNYWRSNPSELEDSDLEAYEKDRRQRQQEQAKKMRLQSSRTRFFSV